MSERLEEIGCFRCPIENLDHLYVTCKNYKVRIVPSDGTKLVIRYHENRFRQLEIRKSESGLYLEEKMAVTFYGLFRLLKLMEDNELEIEIPNQCTGLNIEVETGVTGIIVNEIHVDNLHLTSSSGRIQINHAVIGKKLFAHSVSNKIYCQLPGVETDYNIDCRIERRDVCQPAYPMNHNAVRSVILRSNMYVPQLMFSGEV